jgi:hypothetical protein
MGETVTESNALIYTPSWLGPPCPVMFNFTSILEQLAAGGQPVTILLMACPALDGKFSRKAQANRWESRIQARQVSITGNRSPLYCSATITSS